MSIQEVLEHPWFSKINKNDLPEKRKRSRENSISSFKIYSTTSDS
jgi:hypothetical protein